KSSSDPSTHFANFAPCLKAASHSRINAVSDIPIFLKVPRMVGQVPSPTPMGLISGDSIRVTLTPNSEAAWCFAAMVPAVIQPAVPPPTITTDLRGVVIVLHLKNSRCTTLRVKRPPEGGLFIPLSRNWHF